MFTILSVSPFAFLLLPVLPVIHLVFFHFSFLFFFFSAVPCFLFLPFCFSSCLPFLLSSSFLLPLLFTGFSFFLPTYFLLFLFPVFFCFPVPFPISPFFLYPLSCFLLPLFLCPLSCFLFPDVLLIFPRSFFSPCSFFRCSSCFSPLPLRLSHFSSFFIFSTFPQTYAVPQTFSFLGFSLLLP